MRDFEGIITALLTPFDREGEVLEDALRKIVDFQVTAEINGFFICGTAGSGPLMRVDQRMRVCEVVIDQVRGRRPVIAQVGSPDTDTTIALAKHAVDVGVEAVGCLPPYFYVPDRETLVRHFQRLSEAVEVPIFVYNNPSATNFNITPQHMLLLAEISGVLGVKDSSRDFNQVLELLERLPKSFIVINGTDTYLYPALLMGANGGITGYSNPFPEIYMKLFRAYKEGDHASAVRTQFQIIALRRILRRPTISPLLEALKMRKIITNGDVKRPFRPLTGKEREKLYICIKNLGLDDLKWSRHYNI
ncbi:MAG: hypothetical protein GTO54_00575 [Nitrososphaeria archaeon]|nr:hypothetical protein [Nitrososphaeria archaeon]